MRQRSGYLPKHTHRLRYKDSISTKIQDALMNRVSFSSTHPRTEEEDFVDFDGQHWPVAGNALRPTSWPPRPSPGQRRIFPPRSLTCFALFRDQYTYDLVLLFTERYLSLARKLRRCSIDIPLIHQCAFETLRKLRISTGWLFHSLLTESIGPNILLVEQRKKEKIARTGRSASLKDGKAFHRPVFIHQGTRTPRTCGIDHSEEVGRVFSSISPILPTPDARFVRRIGDFR
jgi:hypothetical protein